MVGQNTRSAIFKAYPLSDLPQAVEEYAHRVAPAIANNYSKAGVVVNFVTATGGDVEMLRSIECFYKYVNPRFLSCLYPIY